MRPIPTRHYLQRCSEREIPPIAAELLADFGEERPGRHPGEAVLYLSPLTAFQLHQRGIAAWDLAEVAVVIVDGCAATAFRLSEDDARRRWPEEGAR